MDRETEILRLLQSAQKRLEQSADSIKAGDARSEIWLAIGEIGEAIWKFKKPGSLKTGWLQMDELPFGKTLAYDLIERGELESVVVGKVGTKRGRRLISIESLNRYLKK